MTGFPPKIQALEPFSERFEAFRLRAAGADVLFATYPAGTKIESHDHDTENHGVITKGELILIRNGAEERYGPGDWYSLEAGEEHAARFEVETEEIEFWFRT